MAKIKKIVWRKEFGEGRYPFCPYCNEFAYEQDHCVFCAKKYEWVDEGEKTTVVEHNGYIIIQCTNNHIQIYKDGQIVLLASCTKKMTEEELKGQVAFLEMMRKDTNDNEE